MQQQIQLLEDIATERQLSPKSLRNYYCAVNQYQDFSNMKMEDLLLEAETEEEEGIRWKKRTLKKRLTNFRSYLAETSSKNTTTSYFGIIKTIYRHCDIEIHDLPSFKSKQGKVYDITFRDLISKMELLKAYDYSTPQLQAIILFLSSSGVTRIDATNITVAKFIESCQDYLTTDTLPEQLTELYAQDNVVPTFFLKRQKTMKNFYTFCTPEATHSIVNYLLSRKNLSPEDKLFNIHPMTINHKFAEVNDKLHFGDAGAYRKFTPHMLRRFQASMLTNSAKFTEEEVDVIQGRSKDMVHRAYFKNDPKVLWEKYVECVPDLSVVNVDKLQLDDVKKENSFLKSQIDEQENKMNTILANQKRLEVLLQK